jgi:hypothetical protein
MIAPYLRRGLFGVSGLFRDVTNTRRIGKKRKSPDKSKTKRAPVQIVGMTGY